MGFQNTYEDPRRAAAYDELGLRGTYDLVFRNLPGLLRGHVQGRRAVDFGLGLEQARHVRTVPDILGVGDPAREPVVRDASPHLREVGSGAAADQVQRVTPWKESHDVEHPARDVGKIDSQHDPHGPNSGREALRSANFSRRCAISARVKRSVSPARMCDHSGIATSCRSG